MMDHVLWSSALTQDLYTRMFQAGDLNTQLMNRYYGDGAPDAPKDEDILAYVSDELQIAYKAKHILLKTVDTDKPIKDEDGKATGKYEPWTTPLWPRRRPPRRTSLPSSRPPTTRRPCLMS